MYTKPSTRQLGSKGVTKRIVLFLVLVQFVVCTATLGDLINITGAEQQVGGSILYKDASADENLIEEHYYPPDPLGLENADLSGSFSNSGYSVSAWLTSDLTSVEGQITANGSAFASAVWGQQPSGAWDVHGGAGSTFKLTFTRGSAPVFFYVSGQLNMAIEYEPTLHPEESFAYVKLSSLDGDVITEEWSIQRDCSNGDIFVPFAEGLWLEYNKTYILEAHTRAGTVAMLDNPYFKSRTTSFSFATTVTEGEPAAIDIVQDSITTRTKTITCYIRPPEGYNVSQIDQTSIRLEGSIAPLRTSVRKHQQMLVVKFPTSGLTLEPGPLELTVSGELTDGTTFEDSDLVTVVQKGGKPS